MGKLLRINLSKRRHSIEQIDPHDFRDFLGGRGLGALWYWREIRPDVRPLDAENRLGFFTGPMTGTPLVSTTKIQLMKSFTSRERATLRYRLNRTIAHNSIDTQISMICLNS